MHAATIAGQESCILMQGGSKSGKTFTLEGGVLPQGGTRETGLIERLVNHLWTACGGPLGLHLVETRGNGETICLFHNERFASPSATVAAYRRAVPGLDRAHRQTVGLVAEEGLSTRSWTHLVIVRIGQL